MDDPQHRAARSPLPQHGKGLALRQNRTSDVSGELDDKVPDSPPDSGAPFLKVVLVGGCVLLVAVIVMVTSREEELRRLSAKTRSRSSPAYVHDLVKASSTVDRPNGTGTETHVEPVVRILHQLENGSDARQPVAGSRERIERMLRDAKARIPFAHHEGARPRLCVVSRAAKQPLQFPKRHCTHLVYSDVRYDPQNATFTPVSEATLAVFKALRNAISQKFLVSIAETSVDSLLDSSTEQKRFAEAASRWLTSFAFHGIAFLGQKRETGTLAQLKPLVRVLQSVLAPLKLKVILGLAIQDWDSQPSLIARRLAALAENVDYLILETHYQGTVNGTCRPSFPSVLYSDDPNAPTAPIAQALSWMSALLLEHKSHINTCFSLTLGALLFKGAETLNSACTSAQTISYMKVCKDAQWSWASRDVDALAEKRLGNAQLESHESLEQLPTKVSRAMAMFPLTCVAAYDVDLDDYEGECGKAFSRLEAIERTQEAADANGAQLHREPTPPDATAAAVPTGRTDGGRRRRCMPPGKEYTRPLVCVLSDRLSTARNFTKKYCTHIVLSLRSSSNAMVNSSGVYKRLKSPDVKVFVALHERSLLTARAEELAESTTVLLRGTEVDGLAFLYVSQSTGQLDQLLAKLQALHSSFEAAGLCLLLSLQLAHYMDRLEAVENTLRDVSKHVDILVVNTHYAGSLGFCRAMPLSVFQQGHLRSCIPTLAVETALKWHQFIASTSTAIPFLCFSVDMRVFRYSMYGPVVLQGTCSGEEHDEYGKACLETDWSPVYNVSTDSLVRRKGNQLETFDTAHSLRRKVTAALQVFPQVCVAVFSYDYDDLVGVCKDPRLSGRLLGIRSALDRTSFSSSQKLTEYEEPVSTRGESLDPRAQSLHDGSERPLVCVLSSARRDAASVPKIHCTHLVHREARYDFASGAIHVQDGSLGLISSRPNMKHVAGLSGEVLLDSLLGAPQEVADEVAASMALSARRLHFDGVAILDFNRTSRTISSFAPMLNALRKAFSRDLVVVLGVEILDGSLPPKTVAKRLVDTLKLADIVILQTHYRSGRGYCQLSYPSVYEYKEGSLLPLATALEFIKNLRLSHVCISFNMALLQFDRINNSSDCQRVTSRSYAETCDQEGWQRDDETSESFSAIRQKGGVWQSFESIELLGRKVERSLMQCTSACVAAFNVDLEDATQACEAHGRKFGRLAAIAEKYVDAQQKVHPAYQVLPPIVEEDAIFRGSGLLGSESVRHRTPHTARSTVYRPEILTPDGGRPFVCLLSCAWEGPRTLPPPQCTHLVLSTARTKLQERPEKMIALLKGKLSPAVKYYVRLEYTGLPKESTLTMLSGAFHGVALVDVRVYSVDIPTFIDEVVTFRSLLPTNYSLLLGLEVADFDEDANVVAKRLKNVLYYADIIVLQTHLRKDWGFCQTAFPSVYRSWNDSCIQTSPIANALKWMQLMDTSTPRMCISFNFAAVHFELAAGNPGVGELCHSVYETDHICESGAWNKAEDRDYAMAAFRHRDDVWVSLETERLLFEKVRKAIQVYPRLCVAAFNVDFDASSNRCGTEPYSRLSEVAIAAEYTRRGTLLSTAPRGRDAEEPDWYPAVRQGGSLVCVFSTGAEDAYPLDYCDYYVYAYVRYEESTMHLRADAEALHTLSLIKRKRPSARFLVAISPADFSNLLQHLGSPATADRLTNKLHSWLQRYNLDGLAFINIKMSWFSLVPVGLVIHNLRCRLQSAGYSFVFGLTITHMDSVGTTSDGVEALKTLFRSVDVLVLETHMEQQLPPASCRVYFPSMLKESTEQGPVLSETAPIRTVAEYAALLARISDTPVCFSLSMAVRTYVTAHYGEPGGICNGLKYDNYSVTCHNQSGWSVPSRNSIAASTWRRQQGHIQTYDTVQDAVDKLVDVDLPCVAAYDVEYDDPFDECQSQHKFPRLHQLNNVLVNIVRDRKSKGQKVGRMGTTLICVVSDVRPDLVVPCDHVVYYGVAYTGGAQGFIDTSQKPGRPLEQFLARNRDLRRYVALSTHSPEWYMELAKQEDELANFTAAMTRFFEANQLQGLALIRTRMNTLHAEGMARFLRMLHCSMGVAGFTLIFGVAVTDRDTPTAAVARNLSPISRAVDILVIETHLEQQQRDSCVALYPSSMHGTISNVGPVPIEMARTWILALPAPQPVLCYSLSLAVHDFSVQQPQPGIGDTCTTSSLLDYREMCSASWPRIVDNNLTLSTYRTQSGRLQSYDTREDVRLKVTSAHIPCVAAYDVDYDDPEGSCARRLFRTNAVNRTLRDVSADILMPGHVIKTPNRDKTNAELQHTVVCVFSRYTNTIKDLPLSACDYVVLREFGTLDGSGQFLSGVRMSVVAEVTTLANDTATTFVMAARPKPLAGQWGAGRSESVRDGVREAINWMKGVGFRGFAFFHAGIRHAEFATHTKVLELLRDEMKHLSVPEFEILLSVPFTASWQVWSRSTILDYVDIVVFTTHDDEVTFPCKVKFPSSYESEDFTISSVTEAAALMHGLKSTRRSLPLMCFSLTLAVLKFTVGSSEVNIGDRCSSMERLPYSTTCPLPRAKEDVSDLSVAAYKQAPGVFYTYENEHSAALKVMLTSAYLPKVCVAAFRAELEDANGTCKTRPPASRLRAIKNSLAIPETTAVRKKLPNPVVCVVGGAAAIQATFPAHLCDIVVLSQVEYDKERHVLKANATQFEAFMALRDWSDAKLVLALDPSPIEGGEYAARSAQEELAMHVAVWLKISRMDGLAIFTPDLTERKLHRHIHVVQKLRAAFLQDQQDKLLLYGAPLTTGYTNWPQSTIATYIDLMIFIIHRYVAQGIDCTISFPGTFPAGPREEDPSETVASRIRGLKSVVSTVPNMAMSINLGVCQFYTPYVPLMLDAVCVEEQWVNYAETCPNRTNVVHVQPDYFGAYQVNRPHVMRTFETEDTVRSKVRLFVTWVSDMGVALFNADLEDATLRCPVFRGNYSRIQAAHTTIDLIRSGVRPDRPVTRPGPAATTTALPEPTAKPSEMSPTPLACVFGENTLHIPSNFPKYMCDFVILIGLAYNETRPGLVLLNDALFREFLAMTSGTQQPHSLVAVRSRSFTGTWLNDTRLRGRFVGTLTEFLTRSAQRLHGIMFQHTVLVDRDLPYFSDIVRLAKTSFAAVRSGLQVAMAAAVPLFPASWEAIYNFFAELDLMIMTTHREKPVTRNCRVVAPDTYNYEDWRMGVWAWAVTLMRAVVVAVGNRAPTMFFTFNLAALQFQIRRGAVSFDDLCVSETWTNYSSTCPTGSADTFISAKRIAAYRQVGRVFTAFENEDTVSVKVKAGGQWYPKVGVAAYEVAYEDARGTCALRIPFSRLGSIRRALNGIVPIVGNLLTLPDGSSFDYDPLNPSPSINIPPLRPTRRVLYTRNDSRRPFVGTESSRRQGRQGDLSNGSTDERQGADDRVPTICFFTSPASGLPCLPKRLCSQVVYDGLKYDPETESFVSSDGTWEAAMAAAVAGNMKLFLGFRAATLFSLYEVGCKALYAFAQAVVTAAATTSNMRGVSIRVVWKMTPTEKDRFPDALRRVRTSLDSANLNLSVIVVVSPAVLDDDDTRAVIVEVADLIVYAGNFADAEHHVTRRDASSPSLIDCGGDLPTQMTSMDGMSKLYSQAKNKSSLCISLNLAVYKFHTGTAADVPRCSKANYSEACFRGPEISLDSKYATVRVDKPPFVFFYDDDSTLSTKMLHFRGLYPEACVALLEANAEDYDYTCHAPFSRISHVRGVLRGDWNASKQSTTAHAETSSHGETSQSAAATTVHPETTSHEGTSKATAATSVHAETSQTTAATSVHAETSQTTATTSVHAETSQTTATTSVHAETSQTTATTTAHAETSQTTAATTVHAETSQTTAAITAHTGTSQTIATTTAHTGTSQTIATTTAHTGTWQTIATTTAHAETSQTTTAPPVRKPTLVCIAGTNASLAHMDQFPAETCDYLVYPPGSYNHFQQSIRAMQPTVRHQEVQSRLQTRLVLALESDSYLDAWVTNKKQLEAFTRALADFLRKNGFQAFAITIHDPNHISNILIVRQALKSVILANEEPLHVVLGTVPLLDDKAMFALAMDADVFIVMTQHIPGKLSCKIQPPTRTDAWRALLSKKVDYGSMQHYVRICAPVGLAVLNYQLLEENRRSIGDKCFCEVVENYSATCPDGQHTTKDELAAYRSNRTFIQVFEDEETLFIKMNESFVHFHDVCIAAFSVELEDLTGACTQRLPLSRLMQIRKQLDNERNASLRVMPPSEGTSKTTKNHFTEHMSGTQAARTSISQDTGFSTSKERNASQRQSTSPSTEAKTSASTIEATSSSASTGGATSASPSQSTSPSTEASSSAATSVSMIPSAVTQASASTGSDATGAIAVDTTSSVLVPRFGGPGFDNLANTTRPGGVYEPSDRHSTTPQAGREPRAVERNTMLCFISPPFRLYSSLGSNLCDYLVFDAVSLNGSGNIDVPGDEWKYFLQMRSTAKLAVSVDPETLLNASRLATAADAAALLYHYGLHAAAIVLQNKAHEVALPWLDMLQKLRAAVDEKTNGQGELIFGASPSYLSREALHHTLFRLLNILVYVNHHTIVQGANCSVAFPSGQFFEDHSFHDDAIKDMQRHRDKVICKSVNLAVFRYALQSSDAAAVGTPCRQEVTDNYAEVCPPPDRPSDHDPAWVAAYYQDKFNFITFEDEHSLREKIATLRNVLPSICIAAFRIELEDHPAVCPHRDSFFRLANIRRFLEEPIEHVPHVPDLPDHIDRESTHSKGPTTEEPAADISGRLAKEPRSSGQLVCFLSPPVKTLQGYPAGSCDYIVYHPTVYDIQLNRFYQPDETSWNAFLSMSRLTKFLVSVDGQSVAEVEKNSSLVKANFVRLVPLWLSKYELRGIGLMLSPRDDLLLLHSALTRLREHFTRYREGTFRIWLGAPPTLHVSTQLTGLADIFVYATNHVPIQGQGSCQVSYPSVMPQMATVSEPLLAAKHMKENSAANLTICISINLAVLVFWQEVVNRKVGASCKQGAETDYAELCRQVEIKISPDSEWMAAFLQADQNNTLYTFETEDMLKTKVSFFKSWFPDVCLAVFHTERDVYGAPCPQLPPFSRLLTIRHTLDAAVDPRRAHSRSKKALQSKSIQYRK